MVSFCIEAVMGEPCMQINRATIEVIVGSVSIQDNPMNPDDGAPEVQEGKVSKFRITTTDDLDMIFGLITWPQARPEVRAIEMVDGLSKYERLMKAGRLSLIPVEGGLWLAEMNVMKFNDRNYQTLNRPTESELEFLAGGDAYELLRSCGAKKIGTREELVGETSRTRNALAALFEANDTKAVAAMYTLTRIMAIMFDLGLKHGD